MPYSHGHKWNDEKDIPKFKKLMLEGRSIREIATEFGVSYGAVAGKMKTLGVTYKSLGIENLKLHVKKESPPIEELLDLLKKSNDIVARFDIRQREAFPEFETEK